MDLIKSEIVRWGKVIEGGGICTDAVMREHDMVSAA